MADPKGILFFLDDLDAMEPLTNEEKGRLFTALLKYAKGEEDLELSGNERFLFPTFRSRIDRDRKKYQEKCEKNRENARKRSHPEPANANECKQSQANANDGSEGKRTQPIIKEKEEEDKSKEEDKSEDKNEEESFISNQIVGEGCGENQPDTILTLGPYQNVLLTPSDYDKLKSFIYLDDGIKRLSLDIAQNGDDGTPHYNRLLEWLTIRTMQAGSGKQPEPKKNRDMNFEDMRKAAMAKLQGGA